MRWSGVVGEAHGSIPVFDGRKGVPGCFVREEIFALDCVANAFACFEGELDAVIVTVNSWAWPADAQGHWFADRRSMLVGNFHSVHSSGREAAVFDLEL